MRILPVLDIQAGQVVAGVAGRRHEYQPIKSRLTESTDPLAVARAVRDHFGLVELYIADLDALAGRRPNLGLYAAVRGEGFRLWVDAGLRQANDAAPLAAAGVETLIAALESLAGPAVLTELCSRYGSQRVVFSLDMKQGRALASSTAWETDDPWRIAQRAIASGVGRMIVLDLADVGMNQGTATEDLCRRLRHEHPHLELTTGGGVRGPDDLRRLSECGVNVALVASALHDGRLAREDVLRFGC